MYSTDVNGETTEFGTSGMLYRSNKLMYDRATETLWNQFIGVPVVGPLAGSGIKLEVIPSILTTWEEWLNTHPDTTVISNQTGVYPADTYRPEWDMQSIYFSYRQDAGTMFPVAGIDEGLPIKQQVFGLVFDDKARAYSRSALASVPVLNDIVGGQEVVLVTVAGGGIRAYARDGLRFSTDNDGRLMDNQGREWRVFEDNIELAGDSSQRLDRLPSRDAYWFGWQAFYPDTELWQP